MRFSADLTEETAERDPQSIEMMAVVSRHPECTVMCNGKAEAEKDERLSNLKPKPDLPPFQRNDLSRLPSGRTNQSSGPDAKSQKEKDAATSTCLGTYSVKHPNPLRRDICGSYRSKSR
jgi:hypothetical protein